MHTVAGLGWEELAALAAVMAFVARLGWGAANLALRHLRYRLDAPVKHCHADIGPYAEIPPEAPVKCLIVRYGPDAYLQTLASDQERWEGRLQNRVVSAEKHCVGDTCRVDVRLPVHRRLGTQFKFFIELTDAETAGRLQRLRELRDASVSFDGRLYRVWFLTDRFADLETVGGHRNNYWPPL